MKVLTGLKSLVAKPRGQTMTEYALVIAGVAVAVLFGGYQRLGPIIVGFLNQVIALF